MKKLVTLMFALFIVFAFASNSVAAKKTGTGKKALDETVELTGTIMKIDAAAGKVSIKGPDGQTKEFQVPPQSGIDLTQYKVGDTVTATGDIDATTGNTTLRSFIRKR